MKPSYLTEEAISGFIAAALAEDIGPGDFSSLSSIPEGKTGQAKLLIKDNGMIAGVELAEKIFKAFDSTLQVELLVKDGDQVKLGDIGLLVSGSSASILSSERLVLNCMQRMSGIATLTHRLTEKILHGHAKR